MGFIGRYLDGLDAEERDRVITTAVERWAADSYATCLVGIASGAADSWHPTYDDDQDHPAIGPHRRRHHELVTAFDRGPNRYARVIEEAFDDAFERAKDAGRADRFVAAIKARAAKPYRLTASPQADPLLEEAPEEVPTR